MANENGGVEKLVFMLSAAAACLFLYLFSAADVALATATPKYVVVHAWNPGPDNPNYFKGCSTQWIGPMLDAIGKRGNGAVQLGISDVIYALNTDDAEIRSCLDNFFSSSEQHNIPFMLHIDTERFWDSRPDLWNWFDPAASGYNPANIDNVEWSGWSEGTKESFINWGYPIKLPPKPCYESPAVKRVVENKFSIISDKINEWRKKLADEGREYLFLGVNLGWETGIDDYRDAGWAAAPYKYRLGYNALSKNGFGAANPPANINSELVKVVADFNKFRAKLLYDRGIPKDKIFTHSWAADDKVPLGSDGYTQNGPISSAKNDYGVLGVSLYPPAYDTNRVKNEIGTAPWALIESPPSAILTAPRGYLSVKDWLNFGNCKLAVVYGLSASQSDTLPQIRQLATLLPDNGNPIGFFDHADCNYVGGWVCDKDDFGRSLKVKIFADGVIGQGSLIGTTFANVNRENAVAGLCGGDSKHGFNFPMPASLKDGKSHSIYVYGEDFPSGNNVLLGVSNSSANSIVVTCAAAQFCTPGSANGCKVCNSGGSAWVDTDSKCQSGQICADGVCQNVCISKTCTGMGYSCGSAGDGCGGTLDCGACPSGYACSGNQCVSMCVPKTCARMGYFCGNQSDGCGGILNCGTCAAGKVCSQGSCVSNCASHSYKKCSEGNLYWYNSCDNKEELAHNCEVLEISDYRCNGKMLQKKIVIGSCANDICIANSAWTDAADCSATGKICENGACVVSKIMPVDRICIPQKISGCKVCNTAGTDWINDNLRCAGGETCVDGACVSAAGGTIKPKDLAPATRAEIMQKIAEIKQLMIQLITQLIAELQRQLALEQ
ncbi:MAG: hypothetical protein WC466_06165 [Candidatus Izemoplasmatales bacterium]|jgi:hypothetical protein